MHAGAIRPHSEQHGRIEDEIVAKVLSVAHASIVGCRRSRDRHEIVPKPSRLTHRCESSSSPRCTPARDDPDLGVFVASLERELEARGHEIERAVVDRRAGGRRTTPRARARRDPHGEALPTRRRLRALPRARRPRRRPFLTRAARRHRAWARRPQRRLDPRRPGRDEVRRRTGGRGHRGVRLAARSARAGRARSGGKTEVVDCGVDLERFAPRAADEARRG